MLIKFLYHCFSSNSNHSLPTCFPHLLPWAAIYQFCGIHRHGPCKNTWTRVRRTKYLFNLWVEWRGFSFPSKWFLLLLVWNTEFFVSRVLKSSLKSKVIVEYHTKKKYWKSLWSWFRPVIELDLHCHETRTWVILYKKRGRYPKFSASRLLIILRQLQAADCTLPPPLALQQRVKPWREVRD